jgi:hypothetical protein
MSLRWTGWKPVIAPRAMVPGYARLKRRADKGPSLGAPRRGAGLPLSGRGDAQPDVETPGTGWKPESGMLVVIDFSGWFASAYERAHEFAVRQLCDPVRLGIA